MPKHLTGLQVFIASPGGLKAERGAFRDVIERVNHDHAHAAGVSFIPRGWEYASAGIGRPQSKIDEQVRESDYLVVILWDQWGTPPGGGQYSSGTEEEFRVGLESLKDPDSPMRDIVVLFRGVSERQLADPGDGLKKVLAFKSELEESRILLYSTFDNLDEFKDDFRQHLHGWVRDWQGDAPPTKRDPVSDTASESDRSGVNEGSDSVDGTLAERAKAAVDRGRYTMAEQLFARATTGPYDREAYTEYSRYLRKSGRLTLARDTATTFLHLAQDADDLVGEIEALANLAILDRQQGNNPASLEYLKRAIEVVNELLASPDFSDPNARREALANKAFLLDNKSLTLRRIPDRADDALAALREAQEVQQEVGDDRGAGFTLRNAGSLLYRLGRLDEAEQALLKSLKIFEDVEYASGQATALSSLGEIYEARGEFENAIDVLTRSLAVTPNKSPSRIAMNYAVLARLHSRTGDLESARHFASRGNRAAQELGTPESAATSLLASAQVALASSELEIAQQDLHDALTLFRQVDNPAGIAAVLIELARVAIVDNRKSDAAASLSQARGLLERAPHFGLQVELEVVETEVE